MLPKRLPNNLGRISENFAVELLIKKGYKILDRNFRSRFGEIDVVAMQKDTLVFVEVKARTSRRFGAPEEAVTKSKLDKIIKTGQYYSLVHPEVPRKLRIDVVALEIQDKNVVSSKLITVG